MIESPVAVITGAASGLGAGLVTRAAQRGMRIALADVDFTAVSQRARELRDSGTDALAVHVDVTVPEDLERLAREVWERWGRADLVINNAGVLSHARVWDTPVDTWKRVIDVNLNGVFYSMKAFIPRLIRDGRPARIVNVASVAALDTRQMTAPYITSKHGCLALTEVAGHDLTAEAPWIKVSVAIPGPMQTPIFARAETDGEQAGADQSYKHQLVNEHGMPPDDAAELILRGAERGLLRIYTHPTAAARRIDARHADLAQLERTEAQPPLRSSPGEWSNDSTT